MKTILVKNSCAGVLFLLFVILSANPAYAVRLFWNIPEGEKVEYVYTADVEYYENGILRKVYSERNIIDLHCYKREKTGYAVRGVFSVYRKHLNDDVFRLEEQYTTDFFIYQNGVFDVKENYFMPNVRHLPTFPEYDIVSGSTWKAPVHIAFNNFSVLLILALEAQYTVLFIDEQSKEAIVYYSILIDKTLKENYYPKDFPVRIYGQYAGHIVWDIKTNQPKQGVTSYNILMIFGRLGQLSSVEFKMAIHQKNMMYAHVNESEKEARKKEIEKALNDQNVAVEKDERGMIIRLPDILFDFDKFTVNSSALAVLDKVIAIIKEKYPDNEIIVEGHTDNIGSEEYNQILSERRARTVAEYLQKALSHNKIAYRGWGKNKPIADNATSEGRQRNRRVEIIIKM